MFLARTVFPSQWQLQMALTLSWLVVGFTASGLLSALRWRVDPRVVARAFDDEFGTNDCVLSAVEQVGAPNPTPFHVLLMGRAQELLLNHPSDHAHPAPLRFPGLRHVLVAAFLVGLIWLAPSFGRGLLGEPEGAGEHDLAASGGNPDTNSDADATTSEAIGKGNPADSSWIDHATFTARTDRGTYLLGEEIHLFVKLLPEGEGQGDEPLVIVLTADGDKTQELPVEWELPLTEGLPLVADFPLVERLREMGCYSRGLLALDVSVHTRSEDPAGIRAERMTIQISENVEKQPTVAKSPVEPDPSQQKPQPKQQPPEKPEEPPNKPKGKSKDETASGPEPPPLGEIDSKPVVVEPLFAGDERSRRRVRVYDREREESDRKKSSKTPKPTPVKNFPSLPRRLSKKSALRGAERRVVRRYFERLRERQTSGGGGR